MIITLKNRHNQQECSIDANTFDEFIEKCKELDLNINDYFYHDSLGDLTKEKPIYQAIFLQEYFPNEANIAWLELFIDHIENDISNEVILINNNDGTYTLRKYWDMYDKISSSEMEEFILPNLKEYHFENKELETISINDIKTYLYDEIQNYMIDYTDEFSFYSHMSRFKLLFNDSNYHSENTHTFDPETIDYLRTFWENNIYIDMNIEKLLSQSPLEDITIYFNDEPSEFINCIAQSQGYDNYTLTNQPENDPFLESLRSEYYDYYNADYVEQVMSPIAIPETLNWLAVAQLYLTNNVIFKKGTNFGFFNTFAGQGTALEITLKKDITLKDTGIEYGGMTISRRHQRGDYSPTVVYGLIRQSWPENDQLEVITTEIQ